MAKRARPDNSFAARANSGAIIRHGPNRETVINLSRGKVVDKRPATISARLDRAQEVALVIDDSRRKVIWEHELGPRSAAAVFGDHVLVINVGSRRNGIVTYGP